MSYLRNRLLQAIVTLWVAVTIAFFVIRMMPGGPVEALRQEVREDPQAYGLPRDATEQQIMDVVEAQLHLPESLDEPLYVQYVEWLRMVVIEQDLGRAIAVEGGGAQVTALMIERAPWSLLISSVPFVYGVVVGIILGSFMAYYEGTKFDASMTTAMILNGAIPYYVAAIILLFFLGFQLDWFPTGGRSNFATTPGLNLPYIRGVIYHASLPWLSFIVVGFGGGAIGLRANAIRLLGSDWMRVGRLRGLSTYRLTTAYLARNAILPMYTGLVIGFGGHLGGSIIMEEIFQYPGMGLLLFDATLAQDYTVMMGSFLIFTGMFVLGTLIADFTYALVDPRAEQASMG